MHTTKLVRIGNSTGITLPRDVLSSAGFERGDDVTLRVVDGRIAIERPDDGYHEAMSAGRAFAARYRRTMAMLAK